MILTPSLQIDVALDDSSLEGVDDRYSAKLIFVHPPKNTKPSLVDGFTTQEAFVKKNMQAALKDKVKRNNNLAVEVQGTVVITQAP